MATSGVTTSLATEDDAPTLGSIMTAAFAASDAIYPLIWSSDAVHADLAVKGLFTPVQREDRLTFKAMDGDKIVGFATWNLPNPGAPKKRPKLGKEEDDGKFRGLPDIPGVNTGLWNEKVAGLNGASERDVEPSEDMKLAFFFVHPGYQRRGIGTLLLQWGVKKADELKAKTWLTSSPQAIATYEKNGWEIVKRYDMDLANHGGSGIYSRAWMMRKPGD